MINPEKAVSWMRQQYPHYENQSDAHVYRAAQRKFPEADFPEENPYFQPTNETAVVSNKNINDVDPSPLEFDKLTSAFNLADAYAEEGVPWLGLDPEVFQNSANENISGLIHQIQTGKLKYDVGDYEQDLWGDVAQFFIGIANPIDALAFAGSGGAGGLISKGILQSAIGKKFVYNAVA
jgi:hypothetical protein